MPQKASVALCPGGFDPLASSSSLRVAPGTTTTTIPTSTNSTKTPGTGAGSLWYTSRREVPRGFRSVVAFRCDGPKSNSRRLPSSLSPLGNPPDHHLEKDDKTSISFVIHNHRPALAGGGDINGDSEGGGDGVGGGGSWGESGAVPNSLSVHLQPDGEGGGVVSIRYYKY